METTHQQTLKAFDTALAPCGCEIKKDEPMRLHTSFQIGGPADRMVLVKNHAQLAQVLQTAGTLSLPVTLIGKGSNLLVSDAGIRGVVLALAGAFEKIELLEDQRTVVSGSGVSLAALCKFARENHLGGLEFAWGIPGSVGGAVYMNAGAYGGEIKDVVIRTAHIDADGSSGSYDAKELAFGYRHSVYQEEPGQVLTSATFHLQPEDPAKIGERMEQLLKKRREKQPYDLPSAGSTFKRPAGHYAAALIEQCGLKGEACGGAQVSPKHSGFVVNTGGATCEDVCKLIRRVQERVLDRAGVTLECEVQLIGEGTAGTF